MCILLDVLTEVAYTSDYVCVKADGDLMVREGVFGKLPAKSMTVNLVEVKLRLTLYCIIMK